MAKAKGKRQDLLATAGGNATAAGVTMQGSLAASIAVQAICAINLDSRLGLGAAKPVAVRTEAETPLDDLAVETDKGGWVFVQVKNTLRAGKTLQSELGKTCDECARQWTLAVSGDGSRGWNRPLLAGRDAMVIAVGPATSGPYKVDLPQALNALRMGSTATLNAAERGVLISFSKLLREAFDARGASDDLDLNEVMKFIHVLSFDFDGTHRELAETRLARLLDDPDTAPAAFRTIERECQNAMVARGRLDVSHVRAALEAAGTPVKATPVGTREQLVRILDGQDDIKRAIAGAPPESAIVTQEAARQLTLLRQTRFIVGFEAQPACMTIAQSAENGELAAASKTVRQSIFAWCSRILATVDRTEAERLLIKAEEYGATDETRIARAFLKAYPPNGDKPSALQMLATMQTPESLTASLMIVAHDEEPEIPLQWLKDASLSLDQLHPDGKLKVLGLQITADDWTSALETTNALSEKDFSETPALLLLAGSAFLSQAIHPDFREVLQLPLPQDLSGMPLGSDEPAMEFRAKAIRFYKRSASVFSSLGADQGSALSSDRALWLELRDPRTRATALKELQESMGDEQLRLRRIPLALAFGLKLNEEAIERDIERAIALSGGKSIEASVARLTVALGKKAPELVADIEKHRKQLTQYFTTHYIAALEIEGLAKSGRAGEARIKLSEIEADIEPNIAATLKNLIDEAEGADPVAGREREYAANPSAAGLMKLVDELRNAREFARLAPYAEKLYAELKDAASAETYIHALDEIDADDKIVEFAEANPAVVHSLASIGTAVSWANYRLGRLREAAANLDALRANRDSMNDRLLAMNLAIASGDWSSLNAFVENEWSHRDARDPIELLRAGVLAQRLGAAPRSQELVRAAVKKAERDPQVLVSAYDIASSSGWENDEDIHGWLNTAIETSGEDGPIKRVDFREIVEEQPRWNERVDRAWDLLVKGETPIFIAAETTRRTLLDLTLRPALQNLKEADPRKRGLILSYSGARSIVRLGGKRLAIDITALLSLTVTGLLKRVVDWCDHVYVSHTTLSWLFEERAKLAFHQPSLVRRAHELKRLLEEKQLHRFEGGAPAQAVEHEVGEDIAKYLVAAQTIDTEDTAQKIVIRPYPLSRPGTLLDEKADISGFENHFAGSVDLIEALHAAGHLTETELTNALAFLSMHETPWPHSPKVQPGATLYLDDLAVSYLQHLKLLARLSHAGFKVFITPTEAERATALTVFDESGAEAAGAVELLQSVLRDGIASGKVSLGRQTMSDGPDRRDLHPTHLMIAHTPSIDALVIDDRFVNRYATTNSAPTATSIDVLTSMAKDGSLSRQELTQAMTLLRQTGAIFVPHLAGEISTLLEAAFVFGSRVQETAELRAIRQSIMRIRMTDALQIPTESAWIDNLTRELLNALRNQWREDVPDEVARAKSYWVLELLDPRGWAHRADSTAMDSVDRYSSQVLALMLFPSANPDVRERYWSWLEDSVLRLLKEEDPQSYQRMLASVRGVIDSEIAKVVREEESHE